MKTSCPEIAELAAPRPLRLVAALVAALVAVAAPQAPRAQGVPRLPTSPASTAAKKEEGRAPTLPVIPQRGEELRAQPEREERAGQEGAPPEAVVLDAELPDAGERELIGVSVALECASEEHYAMLLSELELRLPQDVTLITGQSAEVLTKRQIAWRWDALSGCALQLSDERGAVEMPLAPQPSQDQLQQTVMRLAWFVSNPDEELVMTPERAASAPRATPPPGAPRVNAMPSIPITRQRSAAGILEPAAMRNVQSASPQAQSAPESEPQVAQKSAPLQSASGRPNLLASFRDFDQDPLIANFMGRSAKVGMEAQVSIDSGGLYNDRVVMFAPRLGLTFDERFGLGLTYKRLISSIVRDAEWGGLENPPPDQFEGAGLIEMNLLGGEIEARLLQKGNLSWRGALGALVGRVGSESISNPGRQVTSSLTLLDPNTYGSYRFSEWLELGVGVGWRLPLLLGNDWVVKPSDVATLYGSVNLRAIVF